MSVYDALVRMAQDFTTYYRLIDGHGNFGSVDADPAAAMRYTECRLTPFAASTLMQDIAEDTVDFLANFDGNEQEPSVLPSKLPLLLLNGSSGIAVGMATNIPPHNLREILTACRAILKQERITTSITEPVSDDELCNIVPGPDFPTGASIMGRQDAKKLYTTGNGGIVMRAVTHIEQVGRRTAIIVSELPYQVNKAAMLEQIAALVNDKKLEGIADLRDESDRDGIRVVFELKQRDTVPAVVLANLYKKTRMQSVFSGNLVALMMPPSASSASALTPQRFTLREALVYFLDFRFETIRRKTAFQLSKVQARAHIVDGLLIALLKVDEVIELIRSMPDQKSVKEALMISPDDNHDKTSKGSLRLGLSPEQADSVLRLQLGQLTRLNQGKLEDEKADLESKSAGLQKLLDVDDAVYEYMLNEFDEMDEKYGQDRKTKILNDDGEVNEIDLITNARSGKYIHMRHYCLVSLYHTTITNLIFCVPFIYIVVVLTHGGYIKRMPLKNFESQGRGTRGKRGTSDTSSSGDEVMHCITCNDHDTLLMITQNGLAYGIPAYQVPTGSRTSKGTPITSVIPISLDQTVTTVLPVTEFSKDEYIILATTQGWIKKTPLDAFAKTSSRGLTIATLEDGDKLKWCHRCTDSDDVVLGSSFGFAARFQSSSLRPSGRTSRGVRSMKLKEGDTIVDVDVVSGKTKVNGDAASEEEFVLCVTEQGYGKRVPTSEFRVTSRPSTGVIALKFKKRSDDEDRLACFCIVKEDDEILLNTAKGIMVRQKVRQVPSQSRTATGAVLQKVDGSDKITSVSVVPTREEEEEEEEEM